MACFGCSRRASKRNLPLDIEQDLVKTGSLTKKKKKNSLMISWPSWFWTKKSDSKTVPVDISMSGSLDPISKSQSFKLDKNNNIGSSKKYRLPIGVNAINSYKKRLGTVKEIILESREINDLSSLTKEDKKRSSRKKEMIKKTRSISKSSSPPENINPSATVTARVDQTSLPPQKKAKLAARENGNDIVSHEKKESREALDSNSTIGLSIMVVILVLMLFLGKLYAILCTCAWFYMIPRLRTAVDSNVTVNHGLDSVVPDLNSDEHKKRVVLEGLLQRNQRNVIRIL